MRFSKLALSLGSAAIWEPLRGEHLQGEVTHSIQPAHVAAEEVSLSYGTAQMYSLAEIKTSPCIFLVFVPYPASPTVSLSGSH